MGCHSSHVTRISDASSFDEICVYCGATDQVPGGWGQLAYPCTVQDKDRRDAIDQKEKDRIVSIKKRFPNLN